MEYYARSANDRGEKETVRHHLSRTAELCAEYAGVFGCRNEGYVAGEFHDIGKYSDIFEEVLEGRCQGVDHATPGARILSAMLFPKKDGRTDKPEWALVAAVAAHHGILDYDCSGTLERIDEGEEFNKKNKRFSLTKQQIGRAVGIFRDENPPPPRLNTKERFDRCADPQVARMMYVRMLFSSLVDADYSASAEHFDSDYLEKTEEPALNTHVLTAALDGHLKTLRQSSRADAKVNAIRNSVLEQCRQAGREKEGLFTLTAPTGTGKTMAMMAFAAEQLKRGKRRIFFVLPYLSIIDQNAKEYRHIVPRLLEDHSRVELPEELREFSERWTARVIVTTSVRFFESLFAAKSTECRRLHNLANSVILFDEAQTLPVELAQPTLESVALLCDRYDCTAVFSTATQPRFEMLKGMEWWAPKEIISDIDVLFDSTRRVEVSWQSDKAISWEAIAEKMAQEMSVCCIVNLKRHAGELFDSLKRKGGAEGLFYMTTDMCPAHRERALKEIRRRLATGMICRLVATQCVEAGVDLSFDVMYRALAPLESIVQAAGRCNRGGEKTSGRMTVFLPEEERYPGNFYRQAANAVKILLTRHDIDIYDTKHMDEYYRILYTYTDESAFEKSELKKAIKDLNFEETAKQYKLIERSGDNLIVPDSSNLELFERLRSEALASGLTRGMMREAAPITVSCFDRAAIEQNCVMLPLKIKGRPCTKNVESGWYALERYEMYDSDKKGLSLQDGENVC